MKHLIGPEGVSYSGWFIDSDENWYYFNESDKAMKTGWHHDTEDGYWYYLNPSDGKMSVGWQTIDGKEYYFQPVRNAGNYYFSNEQERWLYSLNSNVPYGAMYVSTTTPDGQTVDGTGAKVSGQGTQTVKNGWVQQNGKTYYYDNGIMAAGTWKTIGGKNYYFGSDGVMLVNATAPDGRRAGSDGAEVVNTISQVTAAQENAISEILARELFKNKNKKSVSTSLFTEKYVQDAAHDYLFWAYYSKDLVTPENGKDLEYSLYPQNQYYYDKDKVNELMGNIYGVYPVFQPGDKPSFAEGNPPYLEVSESRITTEYVGDCSIDPSGRVSGLRFSFENGYLNVNGKFMVISNAEEDQIEKSFTARFKVNSNNRFPYQLISAKLN